MYLVQTELREGKHDRFHFYHKDNGHCALVPVYSALGAGTGYERWLEDDLKVKNVIEERERCSGFITGIPLYLVTFSPDLSVCLVTSLSHHLKLDVSVSIHGRKHLKKMRTQNYRSFNC